MKNEVASEHGINIIWNYVKNDYSWKESYFKHFTKGQKFLFFLPIVFLFLPVYGTYELFYNDSWTLFILLGLGTLFSIWWFHKQKTFFENKVSAKYYTLKDCSSINEYHKHKLVKILGKLNTKENRSLWKSYFRGKMKKNINIIVIFIIFVPIYFSQILSSYKKDNLSTYYMIEITLMALLMTVAFIMPAFVNFKAKRVLYNQAYSLILELEKD
ncbi:MAG: hypothetical protein JJE45_04580 [Prolixibacteraceae bacterium]|nr:hypothetical protein [Prolixibacteraceae bacterium]